ncbi:nucleotidyltransferase family protein [Brevundimonas sp.]|uniref:nucleotidyltransferase family protein n=1 Tax=Brevundimonas sp. TaxID=1871086 RepID=UPI003F6F9783
MSDLNARLAAIVRADPDLMHVLTTVRGLGLNDWRVFSGAIYQSVWNAVTGRPVGYGRKDYDLGYFDPDTSWDAEDAVIKRVAAAFEEPFRSEVEVRNQARVHLWFADRFGEPYEALTGTDEALGRFVAPAFAVGVRLEADDTISIAAPFGLEDVFSMTLRPNPHRPLARGWDKAAASARARWPELTVIEPEPA